MVTRKCLVFKRPENAGLKSYVCAGLLTQDLLLVRSVLNILLHYHLLKFKGRLPYLIDIDKAYDDQPS